MGTNRCHPNSRSIVKYFWTEMCKGGGQTKTPLSSKILVTPPRSGEAGPPIAAQSAA